MSKMYSWMKVGNVLYKVLEIFPITIGSANHIFDVSSIYLRDKVALLVSHLVFNKTNKQTS